MHEVPVLRTLHDFLIDNPVVILLPGSELFFGLAVEAEATPAFGIDDLGVPGCLDSVVRDLH